MKVKVKQKHIDWAYAGRGRNPIEAAVHEKTKDNEYYLEDWGKHSYILRHNLQFMPLTMIMPQEANEWNKRFVEGEEVYPFEFEFDYGA